MGGNVFAGKTSSIKIENITPTLNTYFAELSKVFPKKSNIFNEKHFQPVGSVRKKLESGDIDLAISNIDILDQDMSCNSIASWDIDPQTVDIETAVLLKRARTATPRQARMKAFLKILATHINNRADLLYCNEKKVTDGNLFGFYPQFDENGNKLGINVQIDWMIGDINWLKFSYYSSITPEGSNVKGLCRTQLILAAFQVANITFNHVNGIKDKGTGKILANNPDLALKILSSRLGVNLTQTDAENYYTLHGVLKNGLSHDTYQTLIDIYFKILDSTRVDIPDDLQMYWVERQHALNLTGKFLPNNSKLKDFV